MGSEEHKTLAEVLDDLAKQSAESFLKRENEGRMLGHDKWMYPYITRYGDFNVHVKRSRHDEDLLEVTMHHNWTFDMPRSA